MKKVVVFGAGMVAGAHVEYLLEHGLQVTVASRTVSKAQELVKDHPNGRAVAVNSDDHAAMEEIIRGHDLAVSLLPYAYHPMVARLCVKHGVHMVTTSYIKQAMMDLDADAKNAGVILLNEIGVDPGIDHMTAMRVIHKVQAEGGRITKFISFCGGLPAPEANDNPFGYKFSWSPRGVLLAGKNPAHYLWDGEEVNIKAGTLFNYFWTMPINVEGKVIEYEGYPNRDSVPYMDLYGIKGAETRLAGRGAARRPGRADVGAVDAQAGRHCRKRRRRGVEGRPGDQARCGAGRKGGERPGVAGRVLRRAAAGGPKGAHRHPLRADAGEDALRAGRA